MTVDTTEKGTDSGLSGPVNGIPLDEHIDNQNQLWSEFLEDWPIERIREMTLDEYTNANKEDAGAVAVTDLTVAADLKGLDEQINSMMELGGDITVGNLKKIARVCTVCGKEGYITDIKRHIEAAHITGVSHNCNICGKTSRSRHALRAHMSRDHKEFQ